MGSVGIPKGMGNDRLDGPEVKTAHPDTRSGCTSESL